MTRALTVLVSSALRGHDKPRTRLPSDKDHPWSPFRPRGTTPAGWAPGAQSSGRDRRAPLGQPVLPRASPQSPSPGPGNPTTKINHRALNPCLRLCFWGETQAKRPSDSPYAGRAISPRKLPAQGTLLELCAGRDITPSGPPPAWLAPKVLGSLKPPAGRAARLSVTHPLRLAPQAPQTLLSTLIPPSSFLPAPTDTPITTITVWGSDVPPNSHAEVHNSPGPQHAYWIWRRGSGRGHEANMGSCRGPHSSLTGVCAKGDEDAGHTRGWAREGTVGRRPSTRLPRGGSREASGELASRSLCSRLQPADLRGCSACSTCPAARADCCTPSAALSPSWGPCAPSEARQMLLARLVHTPRLLGSLAGYGASGSPF